MHTYGNSKLNTFCSYYDLFVFFCFPLKLDYEFGNCAIRIILLPGQSKIYSMFAHKKYVKIKFILQTITLLYEKNINPNMQL